MLTTFLRSAGDYTSRAIGVNTYESASVERNPMQIVSTSDGGCVVLSSKTGSFWWSPDVGLHVTKLDRNLNEEWTKYRNDGDSDPGAICLDSSGNIYAFSAEDRDSNFHVYKFNSSGTVQFQKEVIDGLGTQGIRVVDFCSVDGSDNIYAFGVARTGTNDHFRLFKFNTSGVIQWVRTLGDGATNMYASGLDTDGSGNVLIAGRTLTAAYGYVAKYNSSGTIQWQKSVYDASTDAELRGVATDSAGNVFVGGYSYAASTYGGIVQKYNSSGTIQWQKHLDVGTSCRIENITVSSSDRIFICGKDESNLPLVAEVSSSGTIVWANTINTGSATRFASVHHNGRGELLLCTNDSDGFVRVPDNGSFPGSGVYGSYTIASTTLSVTTSSYTIATSSLTGASPTETATTSAYALSSETYAMSKTVFRP